MRTNGYRVKVLLLLSCLIDRSQQDRDVCPANDRSLTRMTLPITRHPCYTEVHFNVQVSTHTSILLLHSTFAHQATKLACGQNWSIVSSPNSGQMGNSLAAIAVISANDVWAVGTDGQGGFNSSTQGLTEYWDGTAWSIVGDASPINSELLGVAAVATNDVWAVGNYYDNQGWHTFTEQWNGTSWTAIPSPPTVNNTFSAVAADGADDIWAVGQQENSKTLIEHWDGTAWSVIKSPSIKSEFSSLFGVTVLSSHDVWAVGTAQNRISSSQTLVEHWNGKQWKVVSSPNAPGLPFSSLSSVAASSSHNIWAVGYGGDAFEQTQMLIEHWNGSRWTVVTSPSVLDSSLFAISALSGKNAWAVGGARDPNNGNFITLTVQWNGTAWSIVSSPTPGTTSSELDAVMQVPGTNQVWTVGYYGNDVPDSYQTLTEFYC